MPKTIMKLAPVWTYRLQMAPNPAYLKVKKALNNPKICILGECHGHTSEWYNPQSDKYCKTCEDFGYDLAFSVKFDKSLDRDAAVWMEHKLERLAEHLDMAHPNLEAAA